MVKVFVGVQTILSALSMLVTMAEEGRTYKVVSWISCALTIWGIYLLKTQF